MEHGMSYPQRNLSQATSCVSAWVIVPADVKLIKGNYLLADESTLTGESLPVEKHISDIAYAGAIIRQGEMDAYVVATGISTFFGKTAKLVSEAKTVSHFQKAVVRIGNYLIILAAIMVSVLLPLYFDMPTH